MSDTIQLPRKYIEVLQVSQVETWEDQRAYPADVLEHRLERRAGETFQAMLLPYCHRESFPDTIIPRATVYRHELTILDKSGHIGSRLLEEARIEGIRAALRFFHVPAETIESYIDNGRHLTYAVGFPGMITP